MSTSSVNPPSPPPINPQTEDHKVTIGEVLHYWWANTHQTNSNYSNNNSPTPPQIWVIQNVYPVVTPMRIFCFSLSLISFLLAYGSFMKTEVYKSYTGVGGHGHDHARPLLFFVAAIGHTVWLIFLFFRFCSAASYERYRRYHYVLKSVGELAVMLLVSLLVSGIGHKHRRVEAAVVTAAPIDSLVYTKVRASEVAGLLTCGFLVIDMLCIILLLNPGHHCSLLEATATLTLHLGLVGSPYLGVSTVCFIFVILIVKNFLWRDIGHAQAPANEHHHWAWVALEAV